MHVGVETASSNPLLQQIETAISNNIIIGLTSSINWHFTVTIDQTYNKWSTSIKCLRFIGCVFWLLTWKNHGFIPDFRACMSGGCFILCHKCTSHINNLIFGIFREICLVYQITIFQIKVLFSLYQLKVSFTAHVYQF